MSSNLDLIMLAAKSMSPDAALYLQLKDDYPSKAINWVKDCQWDWPHAVPLDQIDFSNMKNWKALDNRKKIEKFKDKISRGLMKPAVLVKPKGAKLYMIVDGHHRGISSYELQRPMLAWTANVSAEHGPWDVMHDQQDHGTPVKASSAHTDAVLLAARLQQSARFSRSLNIIL